MVDQVTPVALAEQQLPRGEYDFFGRLIGIGEVRLQLDHPVRQLADPVVVSRDDDDSAWTRQLAQQAQDPLNLDVVEMGCRFIGQNELWFVHERERSPLVAADLRRGARDGG